MKDFWGTLTTHIKRGMISPMFLISTALCTTFMVMFVAEYLDPSLHRYAIGLHYFLDLADSKGATYLIMMIVAFPAATMFYDDWKTGYIKFLIPRVGRKKYAFAVTLATGITAAAAMIISYLIFSTIVLSRFPAVTDIEPSRLRDDTMGFFNGGLLCTGHVFLCYLLYFLTKGAMAAFFAILAVFQSMLITNKHLTLISPVLIYILYFSFNFYYILPAVLNPFVLYRNGLRLYLVFGGTLDGDFFSPIAAIYPMFFTAVITAVLIFAEIKILRLKMNRSI